MSRRTEDEMKWPLGAVAGSDVMNKHRVTRILQPALVGALAGSAFALVSCVSLSGEARDMFAFGESCPPGQVSVVPYEQPLPQACVDQSGWHPGPCPPPTPPPDVAADPARLAYWRAHQGAPPQAPARGGAFEVTGCGHRAIYNCSVAQTDRAGPDGRVSRVDVASCSLLSMGA
jgi:hypothetical protein